MVHDLFGLKNSSSDTTSIFFLLKSAAIQADLTDSNGLPLELDSIDTFTRLEISIVNALSSGLRGVFAGWDRWIISLKNEPKKVFLAWFPIRDDAKNRLGKSSVLWLKDSDNEWGVIVEEEANVGYRKVGVVFLHSTRTVTDRKDVVIL